MHFNEFNEVVMFKEKDLNYFDKTQFVFFRNLDQKIYEIAQVCGMLTFSCGDNLLVVGYGNKVISLKILIKLVVSIRETNRSLLAEYEPTEGLLWNKFHTVLIKR